MKCSMIWYGGSSYSAGMIEDLEKFDSLKDLKWSFERRVGDPFTPCVSSREPEDGGPEGLVFLTDNPESVDYPDRIIKFGPRGGVRLERC